MQNVFHLPSVINFVPQLSQMAREIYNSFLSSKATTPVNIDSQAQLADDILNAPRPDMFKEQQLQVRTLYKWKGETVRWNPAGTTQHFSINSFTTLLTELSEFPNALVYKVLCRHQVLTFLKIYWLALTCFVIIHPFVFPRPINVE